MSTDLPKTSWKREAPFRLGDLEVLPASGELRGRRGVERLRPLLMDILLRLAAEPGEVVRRETLLEDVWPRRMVNDEVLSRAIAELRTALGDDARVARYIETLPKLGYRLVATVEPIAAPPVAHAEAATTASAPARKSRAPAIVAAAFAAVAVAAIAWFHRAAAPALPDLDAMLVTARPFTSDPALELAPRFSHDGTRVVFALADDNEARIVIQAVDGSSRQFVGGLEGFTRLSPVFFPDGKRIAYWKANRDDCAIVEHDLESGIERKLVDCSLSPRSRFDLSRDGRWLVFSGTARKQFPSGLFVLELGGGAPKQITSPDPGMGDDLFPRVSPDGKRIVFYRGGESHRQPWIVTRDEEGSARMLSKQEGLSYGLAWRGDGTVIAAADWFGFRALNVIDVASGQARLAGARGARFPDVGPRGEVVWENAVYGSNLWPVDARGKPADKPLWRSTRYTSQPAFSPDGKLVLFASNRDGTDALYVAPLDGEPRRIAFGENQRYLRPHWSADGRSVYAIRSSLALGAGQQEAVRIPVAGGPAEILAPLGHAVNDVREGGDGKLYWGELSAHAMRLMRAPLDDLAHPERLPTPLVSNYQIDSGRLVFSQPQLKALTVCRLETLACEPLGLDISEVDVYHWVLARRSVYLRHRRGDGDVALARFDLATRRIAERWDFVPSGAGASIAVSPDESRLLVAREEGPAIDLMIAR